MIPGDKNTKHVRNFSFRQTFYRTYFPFKIIMITIIIVIVIIIIIRRRRRRRRRIKMKAISLKHNRSVY